MQSPRKLLRKKRSDRRSPSVGEARASVPALSTFASPRSPGSGRRDGPTRNAGANATGAISEYGNLRGGPRSVRYAAYDSASSGVLNLGSSAEGMSATPPAVRRAQTDAAGLDALSARSLGRGPPTLARADSGSASQSEATTSDAASLRRKRTLPGDKAFLVAKELLATERTYRRDLRLLSGDFRAMVGGLSGDIADSVLCDLFASLQPLDDFNSGFLDEVEARLSGWESGVAEEKRIGDLLLAAIHNSLANYQGYLQQLPIFLAAVDELWRSNGEFCVAYRELEARKSTYLPVSALLLRPAHRLLAWQQTLTRLVSHYADSGRGGGPEASECRVALDKLSGVLTNSRAGLESVENFAKLVELQRDLVGVSTLVQPTRQFLREGSLSRLSRKGPVQRLFLLFNDCLLYANRSGGGGQLSFRLHGQIPLRGLMLEDGDPFKGSLGLPHVFTVYGGSRSFIVGAATAEEKAAWMRDLAKAAAAAKASSEDLQPFAALSGSDDDGGSRSPSLERSAGSGHRANNSLHVCWHRCTTLGRSEIEKAGRSGLSGYLLRKFRNSGGWQKLWVVHAHFALFFFKSHEDEAPLASLPLLGYAVGPPAAEDDIAKDHVFKLHYKSHFYFFRTETLYSFHRWLEVIRAACNITSAAASVSALPVME